MDYEAIIKKQIGPSTKLSVLAHLLPILQVLFLILWFASFFVPVLKYYRNSKGIASAPTFFFMMFVFALFAWIYPGIRYFFIKRNTKRCIKMLNLHGQLINAANEMYSPTNTYATKNLFFSANFIFSKNRGFVASYSDVCWIYKHVQSINFIPVSSDLMINTPEIDRVSLVRVKPNKNEELSMQIMNYIYNRNQNIMLGYSPENISAYRAMHKTAKNNLKNS